MADRGGRRAPRGVTVSMPAGFVELTTERQPRHAYWEQELAEYYSDLDRATRSRVLSLLGSDEVAERLARLDGEPRVALGLVQNGREPAGVVLLSVAAFKAVDGWSADALTDELASAAACRPDLQMRELPCQDAVAVLVDHGRTDVQHADVFLADRSLDVVTVVSAFGLASAPIDLLPTFTEVVASYRTA